MIHNNNVKVNVRRCESTHQEILKWSHSLKLLAIYRNSSKVR